MRILKLTFCFFILSWNVFSNTGGMVGGYNPNLTEEEINEANTSFMAFNLNMRLDTVKDHNYRAEVLKSEMERLGLTKQENYELARNVLTKFVSILANKTAAWDSETFKHIPVKGDENLKMLERVLNDSNISLPSNYKESLQIRELIDSNFRAKEYLAKLQEIYPPHSAEYNQQLLTKISSVYYDDTISEEDLKYYINETAKLGIDQDVIGGLLQGSFSSSSAFGNFTPITDEKKAERLQKFLAKHFNFNHKIVFYDGSSENVLCSQLGGMNLIMNEQKNKVEYNVPSNGWSDDSSVTIFGIDTDNPNKELMNSMTTTAKKNIKTLIDLGADVNVTCSNGASFLESIKFLKDAGILEKDYNVKAGEAEVPCLAPGPDLNELGSLCNVAQIVTKLQNILQNNEKKQIPVGEFHFNKGDVSEKCDIFVYDTHVKTLEGNLSRSFEVKIKPHDTDKEFTLTGKKKEDFLKELDLLIKRK